MPKFRFRLKRAKSLQALGFEGCVSVPRHKFKVESLRSRADGSGF